MEYKTIRNQEQLSDLLKANNVIEQYAFKNLDFDAVEKLTGQKKFVNCMFLGCKLSGHLLKDFIDCLIFPLIDVPYNVFIHKLYSAEMLYCGYESGKPETFTNTFDQIVYWHYLQKGQTFSNIKETLSRSLHDHSISDALDHFLHQYDEKKIIGIMGGHSILRTDKSFSDVALISKKLTEKGYLLVSGGGPGAMEATHLGAWMAGKTDDDLHRAVQILSEAPHYTDEYWFDKAMQVLKLYPESDYESVGIPTWHYGHEPSTPFASKIAKYFANSIREDGILTIAKGGIIFTPGSAGTLQEIFQDAAQNHYLSFGYASPMAFYNKKYWTDVFPVYTLLNDLQSEEKYKNLILSLSDTVDEVIDNIKSFTEQH